jgi:hypothetical protein
VDSAVADLRQVFETPQALGLINTFLSCFEGGLHSSTTRTVHATDAATSVVTVVVDLRRTRRFKYLQWVMA